MVKSFVFICLLDYLSLKFLLYLLYSIFKNSLPLLFVWVEVVIILQITSLLPNGGRRAMPRQDGCLGWQGRKIW